MIHRETKHYVKFQEVSTQRYIYHLRRKQHFDLRRIILLNERVLPYKTIFRSHTTNRSINLWNTHRNRMKN